MTTETKVKPNQIAEGTRFIEDTLHIELDLKEGPCIDYTTYNASWGIIDIHAITLADCKRLKAVLEERIRTF